jgi:hypothetical protein
MVAMKQMGDGSRKSGKFTGLGIAQEFANAVCHFLRDHRQRKRHKDGGVELPIDETVWRKVKELEFRKAIEEEKRGGRKTQLLKAYCNYYNNAVHGHGYDLNDKWDCGAGTRDKEKENQGNPVTRTDKAVHPGSRSSLSAEQVIQVIIECLPKISEAKEAAAKLRRQSSAKHGATQKSKRKAKAKPVVDEALAEDLNEIWSRDIKDTTKKTLVNARLGQGKFRADVLQLWDQRCCVTGATTRQVIRASHIKPWRVSNDEVRLDPANGLPLIASLDALFDAGLISFDSSGSLLVSSNLSAGERAKLGINGQDGLKKKPPAKTAEYLVDHRQKHGFSKNL